MNTLSITIILATVSTVIMAQAGYEQAMHDALTKFRNSTSPNEMQAAASQFDRVANVETEEWLPSYYASYIYCIMAFNTEDIEAKESYIDQAQKRHDIVIQIAAEESEVHTLQGMIYQATIGLDPAKNGWKYSSKANGSFKTAIKLNPENPRPYYLQGISVLNTPEMFGGGKTKALPLLMDASEKFDNFVPESNLSPSWGQEDCKHNLKICQDAQASL